MAKQKIFGVLIGMMVILCMASCKKMEEPDKTASWDPERIKRFVPSDDEIKDTVAVGKVTVTDTSIICYGEWRERHTQIPPVVLDHDTRVLKASFSPVEGEEVWAKSLSYAGSGAGFKGTGIKTYSIPVSNGTDSTDFTNLYQLKADAGVVMSRFGKEIHFEAEMIVTDGEQSIGVPTLAQRGSIWVNVYPYAKTANAVYTVSVDGEEANSGSISFSATDRRALLVKADDDRRREVVGQAYSASFVAQGAYLSTQDNRNFWQVVEYNHDQEVSRTTVERVLDVNANVSGGKQTKVDASQLGKVSIVGINGGANQVIVVKDGDIEKRTTKKPFFVQMSDGNQLTVMTSWDKETSTAMELGYAEIVDVRANGVEVSAVSSDVMNIVPKVDVVISVNSPNATKALTSTKSYTIEGSYPQYVMTKTAEGAYAPKVNGFDVTESVYESSSLTGKSFVGSANGELTFALTPRAGSKIYASSIDGFTTTSNGMVGTTTGTYSSTLSNGQVSAENVYDFTYEDQKTLTYAGVSYTFSASFAVQEVASEIGTASFKTEGGKYYRVYPYTNTVKGVMTSADGQKVLATASVSHEIYVEVDDIPDIPGDIISAQITLVPAHYLSGVEGSERYADGSGFQSSVINLCCHTTVGITNIQFTRVFPTKAQVALGTTTYGDYATYASCNSGCDVSRNGTWLPARAADEGDAVRYYVVNGPTRSIRNETLNQWKSSNGFHTSQIEGYSFNDPTQNGGVLIIYHGSETFMLK